MQYSDIEKMAAAQGFNIKFNFSRSGAVNMRLEDNKQHVLKDVRVSGVSEALDTFEAWLAYYEAEQSYDLTRSATKSVVAKKIREFGKNYRNGNVVFKYWNPALLSKKQENVVLRFMERVDGELAGLGTTYQEYAPFIDLIFQFQRHEITQAQFEKITGIHLELSTWDNLHDHNL